jgi:hypothetical protein
MTYPMQISNPPNEVEKWLKKPYAEEDWLHFPHKRLPKQSLLSEMVSSAREYSVTKRIYYAVSEDARAVAEKKEKVKDIEERFSRLVNAWREETVFTSSLSELAMHPKYQNIIGMGPDVLPILFRELRDNPDYWFWALRAITEEDPTQPEDAGDLQKMRDAWLKWAEEQGYKF